MKPKDKKTNQSEPVKSRDKRIDQLKREAAKRICPEKARANATVHVTMVDGTASTPNPTAISSGVDSVCFTTV